MHDRIRSQIIVSRCPIYYYRVSQQLNVLMKMHDWGEGEEG